MAVVMMFPVATRSAGTFNIGVANPHHVPAGTPKEVQVKLVGPDWGTRPKNPDGTPANTLQYTAQRSLDWGTLGAAATWEGFMSFSGTSGTANSDPAKGKLSDGLQGTAGPWDGQEMWIRQQFILTGPNVDLGMSREVLG